MAIWEPRTFKCLTNVACAKAKVGGVKQVENNSMPETVIIKGLIDELDWKDCKINDETYILVQHLFSY